ncbi:FabD/lysophospholipase-like protein [Sistotremastrum suecicum HHB10207 ss-3]|uniref:FabD/lysophospholipase-like protein n=1 Tax=Sistotremastrum suecicum HHB10207 ss-3 TaxID=1314776 RepID=A0A166CSP2_9AGAM|nr:FabD/lysophospholipase-like protein [Sistotremastrum suecicum HHB10207 ss-3]
MFGWVDDGGARGLSEILILQEMMHRLMVLRNLSEMPLPCEVFDLIGGSGTGGLIALFLGRLRMSIQDILPIYAGLAKKVFRDVKSGSGAKFKATNLEKEIKRVVKETLGDEDARMMLGPEVLRPQKDCKTFVCAMAGHNLNDGIPRLFRTYTTAKYPSPNCAIWEAIRATMADPTFFRSITIGTPGSSENYIGTIMGRRNPILEVLQECSLVYPDKSVGCIVSIGAGKAATIALPSNRRPTFLKPLLPDDVLDTMRRIALDCGRNAEETARRYERTENLYYRFDVEQGMQNLGRKEWEELSSVTSHTQQYLKLSGTDTKLGSAAENLHVGKAIIATSNMCMSPS